MKNRIAQKNLFLNYLKPQVSSLSFNQQNMYFLILKPIWSQVTAAFTYKEYTNCVNTKLIHILLKSNNT